MDKEQLISVDGKLITLRDAPALSKLAALTAHC